jgi:transposase
VTVGAIVVKEEAMDTIRDRVAGLDVHRDRVVGCVRLAIGGDVQTVKRSFSTMSAGVAELAAWLADHEVATVVMEATGVYWKSIYYGLEGLVGELWLVNAAHVKRVPGRKTDLSDAEWLADVAAHGMVRPSFVPPPPIRELRELTRYRKTQIDARGREIQRLEKLLQDAGIKLTSVASTAWSKSAQAMVEALIAGERDPERLAELSKGKLRPKKDRLAEALAGRFAAHHGAVARQILDHIAFLDASVAALTAEIVERSGPFEPAIELLCGITGWGRKTAEVFIAETGGDMSAFPTPGQLAAWASVAPASHESAGKRRPAGTRAGNRWLGRALIEAARAAARTNNTYLGAQYRRIAARRGPNKAAVAVAHSMIIAAWHMLNTGETYRDLGADYFTRRNNPEHQARRLARQLEQLGYTVTIKPAA